MHEVLTSALRPDDRLPFWVDVVAKMFALAEVESRCRTGFDGSIRHQMVGRISISEVAAAAQLVTRSRSVIAQAPSDAILVCVQERGDCLLESARAHSRLRPGEARILVADEPYRLHFASDFKQTIIKLAQSDFPTIRRDVHGWTLTRGLSSILRRVVEETNRSDAGLEGSDRLVLASVIRDMVVAGARATAHGSARATSRATLYWRVLRYIEDHLADSRLDRRTIAAKVGMSERNLVRLFRGQNTTINRVIWRRRLSKAELMLCDGSGGLRSINEIAYRSGFKDQSHFSRSFKKEYGISPRAYRCEGLSASLDRSVSPE